jgi:environmental stress-induced protein Ves
VSAPRVGQTIADLEIIAKSKYREMPWKNGLGTTFEIDRVGDRPGHFVWRLSQAEIAATAPFSLYPGFDRLLTVLSGPGLLLNEFRLDPLIPFHFKGEAEINCQRIDGKAETVRDLGLIFDRELIYVEAGDTAKLVLQLALGIKISAPRGSICVLVSAWPIADLSSCESRAL